MTLPVGNRICTYVVVMRIIFYCDVCQCLHHMLHYIHVMQIFIHRITILNIKFVCVNQIFVTETNLVNKYLLLTKLKTMYAKQSQAELLCYIWKH